jgi:glutamine cyclotransferase
MMMKKWRYDGDGWYLHSEKKMMKIVSKIK